MTIHDHSPVCRETPENRAVFSRVTIRNAFPAPPEIPETLKIIAFNMERGIHPEELGDFLEHYAPDIILASELDVGCMRSGNRDIPALLADRLGMNYGFCPEFQELACPEDLRGLHGNAVFSRFPITQAKILSLPREYDWFFDSQKRLGGRNALLAKLSVGSRVLGIGSLHLENRTAPAGRARQLAAVLEAAEDYFTGCPVILGGDLNTNGFDGSDKSFLQELGGNPALRRRYREELFRLEPCLSLARDWGYRLLPEEDGPSTRRKPMKDMPPLELRLDWLLLRQVDWEACRVLSTRREDCAFASPGSALAAFRGEELSDHNALCVRCTLQP